MSIPNLGEFMKQYNFKKAIKNESDLHRVHNYTIYSKNSKINSDKGFLIIDNGIKGGTHWCCFIIKDNTFYYFNSFVDSQINF